MGDDTQYISNLSMKILNSRIEARFIFPKIMHDGLCPIQSGILQEAIALYKNHHQEQIKDWIDLIKDMNMISTPVDC